MLRASSKWTTRTASACVSAESFSSESKPSYDIPPACAHSSSVSPPTRASPRSDSYYGSVRLCRPWLPRDAADAGPAGRCRAVPRRSGSAPARGRPSACWCCDLGDGLGLRLQLARPRLAAGAGAAVPLRRRRRQWRRRGTDAGSAGGCARRSVRAANSRRARCLELRRAGGGAERARAALAAACAATRTRASLSGGGARALGARPAAARPRRRAGGRRAGAADWRCERSRRLESDSSAPRPADSRE
jgi:hypothetical protein